MNGESEWCEISKFPIIGPCQCCGAYKIIFHISELLCTVHRNHLVCRFEVWEKYAHRTSRLSICCNRLGSLYFTARLSGRFLNYFLVGGWASDEVQCVRLFTLLHLSPLRGARAHCKERESQILSRCEIPPNLIDKGLQFGIFSDKRKHFARILRCWCAQNLFWRWQGKDQCTIQQKRIEFEYIRNFLASVRGHPSIVWFRETLSILFWFLRELGHTFGRYGFPLAGTGMWRNWHLGCQEMKSSSLHFVCINFWPLREHEEWRDGIIIMPCLCRSIVNELKNTRFFQNGNVQRWNVLWWHHSLHLFGQKTDETVQWYRSGLYCKLLNLFI